MMNNELMIMSMLERLQQGQDELKTDVADIKERVARLEVTQENVIIPNIQLLAEGFIGIADKMKEFEVVAEKVGDIESTTDVLRFIVSRK